jgi:hypothetical protein
MLKQINTAEFTNSLNFVNSKNAIEFTKSKEFVYELFKFRIPDSEQIIEVGDALEVADAENTGKVLTAYGTVHAQNKEDATSSYFKSLGLVYNLTTAKPKLRIYTGHRVKVCSNLCIFNADEVVTVDLIAAGSIETIKGHLSRFYDNLARTMKRQTETMEQLQDTSVDVDKLNEIIGRGYSAIVKGDTSFPINLFKSGIENLIKSERYDIDNLDNRNLWNVYNAFTEDIKSKNALDEATLSLETYNFVSQIFTV